MGFDRATTVIAAHLQRTPIPGAVLGQVLADGTRRTWACGQRETGDDAPGMETDTWFDLASLTKVIFTTERILAHAAAGRIDLDAPLVSVIPDLHQYHAGSWQRQVTFRDCLGHRTAYPAVEPIYTYGTDPATLRAFVLQRNWQRGPQVYSDINFILLGIALERLEGGSIHQMELAPGLSFAPPADQTAPTEACSWRGRVMRGEVHDENCFALQGSGHAGLFGTIDGVLDFASGLLGRHAAQDGHCELLLRPLRDTRGHGWELAHEGWHGGAVASARTIGHTGFTGTGLWLDLDRGCGWSLLTNRVHPSRHVETEILDLRRAVGEAILEG
ncbi:MAG: beta-lactamase family protein [Rhodobacteraceae bacterium]|nr:beta-lactamase family protein [Paracoccaceae bacterium]MBR9822866.1 beta-lactamase family protein [Paracoccaceae bacterium]